MLVPALTEPDGCPCSDFGFWADLTDTAAQMAPSLKHHNSMHDGKWGLRVQKIFSGPENGMVLEIQTDGNLIGLGFPPGINQGQVGLGCPLKDHTRILRDTPG